MAKKEYLKEEWERVKGLIIEAEKKLGSQIALAKYLQQRGILNPTSKPETVARSIRGWKEEWYLPEKRKKRARRPDREVISAIEELLSEPYKLASVYGFHSETYPVSDAQVNRVISWARKEIIPNSHYVYGFVVIYPDIYPTGELETITNADRVIRERALAKMSTKWYAYEAKEDMLDELRDILTRNIMGREGSPKLEIVDIGYYIVVYIVNGFFKKR